MQAGDLVLLPHLPGEWRWSVVRIEGPYAFQVDPVKKDFGHILPAEIVAEDLRDDELTGEVRRMRAYPARLRRLTRTAFVELERILSTRG